MAEPNVLITPNITQEDDSFAAMLEQLIKGSTIPNMEIGNGSLSENATLDLLELRKLLASCSSSTANNI